MVFIPWIACGSGVLRTDQWLQLSQEAALHPPQDEADERMDSPCLPLLTKLHEDNNRPIFALLQEGHRSGSSFP
jgi:hypothetical protein